MTNTTRLSAALFSVAAVVSSCGGDVSARVELPPVRAGDLSLRAWNDGGFTLSVGGRELLASPRGFLGLNGYTERAVMRFGIWTFTRSDETLARPSAGASSRVEGDTLVLEVSEGGARASLRARRVSEGEVELRVEGATASPGAHRGQTLYLGCSAASHFLGFGEQYNRLDHRGRSFTLWVSEQGIGRPESASNAFSGDHTTTYFPVPFFLDPRGFGLAMDTDARVEVDLCARDASEYTLFAAQPEPLVLHLYTGPTVPDVLRSWTALQGRTATPPRWAVEGVWLGVQGGPEPVRSAVRRARENNIPLAAVWSQDWLGRRELSAGIAGQGQFGVRYRWSADETLYPDLPGLVRELRGEGVRFLGYFNSFLVPEQDLWETALRDNHVVRNRAGQPYTFPISVLSGSVLDLTSPRAVQWFQGYARRAIEMGQSGWMHDFGEWLPQDAVLASGEDSARVHNRYPERWQRAAREELERAHPDGDWVLLSRSGWLRTSRVSQVVWAGDQEANWEPDDGLPTVVPAMISLGLAGVGFCTHDVAGFSGGPSTRELFLRWVELGAFSPVFRTHEGLRRNDNWRWDRDAETLAHFGRFARVHRALAPRLMELGAEHQRTGMPIVRALSLHFPDDPRTYDIRDEYMLGDDLLVAPVLTRETTSRRVYLPRGAWFDVWDPSRRFEGPREVTVEAPIGRPPVFSRTPRGDLAALR